MLNLKTSRHHKIPGLSIAADLIGVGSVWVWDVRFGLESGSRLRLWRPHEKVTPVDLWSRVELGLEAGVQVLGGFATLIRSPRTECLGDNGLSLINAITKRKI